MKKVLISFGDAAYTKSLNLLEKTSLEIGKVDQFIGYNRNWLNLSEFYNKNKFILDGERGGYWAWKMPIILETFNTLEYGDVVMYSDAGIKVINDLTPLYELAAIHQRLVFKIPGNHLNKFWTKRDAFVLLNADDPKYWNANQVNGAVSLWVKTDENIAFIKEWNRGMKDPRIVMNTVNMCGKPNFLEFKDHRYDQSVLSILAVKYNFEVFRDPTQWGNEEIDMFPNSTYPQLFHHHRNFKH